MMFVYTVSLVCDIIPILFLTVHNGIPLLEVIPNNILLLLLLLYDSTFSLKLGPPLFNFVLF